MKSTWILVCGVLLASAPLALCDNNATNDNKATENHATQAVLAESTTAASAAVPAGAVPIPGMKPAWIVSTSVSHPVKTAGVPNFGMLNDHIWRSGQPSRQGYKLLASRGLKTVVNLREEFPQDKELIPPGVNYIYIPIKDEHAPTEEQAEQFMRAASDPANWPLLVHCHAGEGRAGTMAALVRCSMDNWDDSAVMKETNGFISAKFMGLVKPELAGGQRRLIQQWEAKSGAILATAQRAAGVAPANVGGSPVATQVTH